MSVSGKSISKNYNESAVFFSMRKHCHMHFSFQLQIEEIHARTNDFLVIFIFITCRYFVFIFYLSSFG